MRPHSPRPADGRSGSRRLGTDGSFSNDSVATAVGLDARATLDFRGSQVQLYWTQGFIKCRWSTLGGTDHSGITILVTVDSAASPVLCNPGKAVYNALAYTSPPLDPTTQHTIVVQIEPTTNAPDSDSASRRAAISADARRLLRPGSLCRRASACSAG